jgi:hypothetical protein
MIVKDYSAVVYCFCFCSSSSASSIIAMWESKSTVDSNTPPLHGQLTHLPKLNFAPRPARPDHSPQTSTTNRGTWTTRVCPIWVSVKCDQPGQRNPKTYVWRSPKSAETALISLSRRSRRSPLDEEDQPPPPPIVGVT